MSTPLIEFRNVTVSRDGMTALHTIDLSIATGENVAVLGPNGSGKSSLIKTITRECYPRQGSSARILGHDVWNLFELRAHLGVVSNDLMQACTCQWPAREIALSGFFGSVGVWPYHIVTPAMERRTDEVLELLEVAHLAQRPMAEMSSGEARRVLIARALVHAPQALVLDEPTTSLDFRAKHELRAVLRKLAQSGHQHRAGHPQPHRHHPGNRARGALEERPHRLRRPQGAGPHRPRPDRTLRYTCGDRRARRVLPYLVDGGDVCHYPRAHR